MVNVLEKPELRVPIVGTAAIYIRVSTGRQKDEGNSLEVQLEACQRYCDDHGLIVVGVFRDIDSGLNPDRIEYAQVVDLARSKGTDKVVVWRFDRLGRDAAEYIPVLKELKRLKVEVISVTQPTESTFMQQLIGIWAEEESRQTSVRTTAGKRHRAEQGNWVSLPPLGYFVEKPPEGGTVLVPNEHAPLVIEMFKRYANGYCSIKSLREFLKEAGVSRSTNCVWKTLHNPAYLGIVQFGHRSRSQFHQKEVGQAQGRHQPLIDQETFDKVQARLEINRDLKVYSARPKHLFTGLIFCGKCDCRYSSRLVSSRSGKIRQYICNRKVSFKDCQSRTVLESRIQNLLAPPIKTLLSSLKRENVRKAVRQELAQQVKNSHAVQQQSEAAILENQHRLEARLSRLEDTYLDGDLSKNRYLTKRDEILSQLEEYKTNSESQPKIIPPDMTHLFAIAESIDLNTLDYEAWREIITEMVDRIIIGQGPDIKVNSQLEGASITVVWKPEFEQLLKSDHLVPVS